MSKDTIKNVQCPECESTAVYRDGWARTGKQRYLCLMCGMQFTDCYRARVQKKPLCVACGSTMYQYNCDETAMRFSARDTLLARRTRKYQKMKPSRPTAAKFPHSG